jgi:hypothetical protein
MKASTWRLIVAGLLASAAVVKAADEFNCPKGQFWRNDDYNPSSEPGTRMRMLFVTKHFSNLRSFTIIGQTDFECVVQSEKGETVEILKSIMEDALKAGYLVDRDLAKIKADAEKQRINAEKQKAIKAQNDRIALIKAKKLPPQIEKAILDRKVQIGMTDEQVKLSWGNPGKINRTVTVNHVSEQWVYGSSTYLYFDNGVLTSFQDSR